MSKQEIKGIVILPELFKEIALGLMDDVAYANGMTNRYHKLPYYAYHINRIGQRAVIVHKACPWLLSDIEFKEGLTDGDVDEFFQDYGHYAGVKELHQALCEFFNDPYCNKTRAKYEMNPMAILIDESALIGIEVKDIDFDALHYCKACKKAIYEGHCFSSVGVSMFQHIDCENPTMENTRQQLIVKPLVYRPTKILALIGDSLQRPDPDQHLRVE